MSLVSEGNRTSAPVLVESKGSDETRVLAGRLAGVARAGDLVLLVGDLGAGKTTFAQGFARALGVVEPVTSPTFTLVRRYPLAGTGASGAVRGIRTLLHADLYRLETLGEVADLALPEQIEDRGVALVEWGDVAVGVLGDRWLEVRFEITGTEARRITLASSGPAWAERWPRLTGLLAGAPPGAGGSLEESAGR